MDEHTTMTRDHHITFKQDGDFANAQRTLLHLNIFEDPDAEADKREYQIYKQLSDTLDAYQEQSYLLDPYLESLVTPVIESIKNLAKASVGPSRTLGSSGRVRQLSLLLYQYVKCRGYKTIIRYFPHDVADLSIALEFMLDKNNLPQKDSQWALRYAVLLWLSLICMIPFDLEQFDEYDQKGSTARSIEAVAKRCLGKAGLEREAAAILLSRLYTRKDTATKFSEHLSWTRGILGNATDIFQSIGSLQVICELTKSGSSSQVKAVLQELMDIARIVGHTAFFARNTFVRKLKTKLVSRIALRILPTNSNPRRRKDKTLSGVDMNFDSHIQTNESEVPDDVEVILEYMFSDLQDKDTVVRWSAAKGIARIAERLPDDLASQVLETIIKLFTVHSVAAASLYDLPAIAESTWHGACLACAEMARRNLIPSENLAELIFWLSKALYFDLRQGAHSVGSNVRDAASYVLWALARAQNPDSLVPHANSLANHLVTVALYDREIHIRRAASAAFQEHVGRTNLFPHGIDVLGKTDFYAVSIRRNSFLVAAPLVAVHLEYRQAIFEHITNVVLRHWDKEMRELGAQSLGLICHLDLPNLGPQAKKKSANLIIAVDANDTHGGLLALSEIALAYLRNATDPDSLERQLCEICGLLRTVTENVLMKPRNELVTIAACKLVTNAITVTEIRHEFEKGQVSAYWMKIIVYSLKHRKQAVQEAGADALAAISKLEDFSSLLVQDMRTGPPASQQSLARLLGVLDYDTYPVFLPNAINHLLENCKASNNPNIETRRLCYQSMSRILKSVMPHLSLRISSDVYKTLFLALIDGLDDYSVDERGDVGSWVRLACIQGSTTFAELLLKNADSIPGFEDYLPPEMYYLAVRGILKQGVERLDNVRQAAGECFMLLLALQLPSIPGGIRWRLPGYSLLKEWFQSQGDVVTWNEGKWLFPRAIRLLDIKEYRESVLAGIVFSLGGRTDSTQRPLASSFVHYVQTLPTIPTPDSAKPYSVLELAEDLLNRVKSHLSSNAVFIPILQTYNVLLEAGVLKELSDDPNGLGILNALLAMSSRNVARLKSVQRIHESMKIVVNLLTLESLTQNAALKLIDFLTHPFPRIRADTAEYLYLALDSATMSTDLEDVQTLLLETDWSSDKAEGIKEEAKRIVEAFKSEVCDEIVHDPGISVRC